MIWKYLESGTQILGKPPNINLVDHFHFYHMATGEMMWHVQQGRCWGIPGPNVTLLAGYIFYIYYIFINIPLLNPSTSTSHSIPINTRIDRVNTDIMEDLIRNSNNFYRHRNALRKIRRGLSWICLIPGFPRKSIVWGTRTLHILHILHVSRKISVKWYAPGLGVETSIYLMVNPQWIGLRENLQETIDFPIKYGA